MKALYDTEPIELTKRFTDAIIELMRAECGMMRKHEPQLADCWTWGRCRITDLARADGLSFEFGGADEQPRDGCQDFAVIADAS